MKRNQSDPLFGYACDQAWQMGVNLSSGRVMCEHYWLSVLLYTPGMSVMTLLLKNRYERKRSRDFFLQKKKMLWLFSIKRNLLEIKHLLSLSHEDAYTLISFFCEKYRFKISLMTLSRVLHKGDRGEDLRQGLTRVFVFHWTWCHMFWSIFWLEKDTVGSLLIEGL